eukprot:239646-Rhodomonas_salina.4
MMLPVAVKNATMDWLRPYQSYNPTRALCNAWYCCSRSGISLRARYTLSSTDLAYIITRLRHTLCAALRHREPLHGEIKHITPDLYEASWLWSLILRPRHRSGRGGGLAPKSMPVSYTHLRAHETEADL